MQIYMCNDFLHDVKIRRYVGDVHHSLDPLRILKSHKNDLYVRRIGRNIGNNS